MLTCMVCPRTGYERRHNKPNVIGDEVSVGLESHRHSPAACPRYGKPVREPTAWSSAWRCDWHGEVHPLLPA
ncbi:MAG TPA: DUF6758 family protein, partial [Streptosporangiaceae bacterium]|nr:DUF6758 family protein [Streptosporangiaceae bacterium]